MALTPAATWTRRIQAQGCKPIVLCTIDTDNVGQHFYFCSGDSPFLMSGTASNGAFAMANITECTPLEIKLDPVSRKASSGEVTVTFVDDGAIRWLNKTYKLYRKRITLQLIEQGDLVGNQLALFSGWVEELLPGEGKQSVALRCRDAWGITLSQQVTGQFKKRHPLVAMKVDILDRINVPASLINSTSFDPTAASLPHSHWNITRAAYMDGQDLSIKQPETAANLLDELALLMNGSVVPMEDGTLTFVRYDYTKAAAATYDTSMIRNFSQKSTFENLINKISLKIFWKGTGAGGSAQASGQPDSTKGPITHLGTGDFALELDHADSDSITAYAYPGVAGSGVSAIPLESKWINNKSVLSDAQTIGYNITAGDTSFYCVGGQIADFCGARTGDAFGTLSAGRPAYLLIDNEVIKATSLTFDSLVVQITGPDEIGVATTSGVGSSTALGSGTQGTNYGTAELARANFSGLTRGMFGTTAAAHFPPAPWQAAHAYSIGDFVYVTVGAVVQIWRCVVAGTSGGSASFPAAPTEGQTTYTDNGVGWLYEGVPTGTIVYDITIAVEYLLATIGRFSDGAPVVEFDLPLSEAFLQAGDNIALTEEIGLRYSVDGFVSSDLWEILGKKTTPIGSDACVHITACLARTPPAYTQAWTGPRQVNWRALLDSMRWAGRSGDLHAPSIIGGAIVAQSSGLNCTISNGVNYAGANRTAPGVVQAFACTASKDVYLSWDSILGMYLKRELANGAAAPPFFPHEVPLAKLVTNGSTITATSRLASQEILKGLHLVADQPGVVGYKRTKLVASLPTVSSDGLLFVDKTTNMFYRDTGSVMQAIDGRGSQAIPDATFGMQIPLARQLAVQRIRQFWMRSDVPFFGSSYSGIWSVTSAMTFAAWGGHGYGAIHAYALHMGMTGTTANTANKASQTMNAGAWQSGPGPNQGPFARGSAAGIHYAAVSFGGVNTVSAAVTSADQNDANAWAVTGALPVATQEMGGCGTRYAALSIFGFQGANSAVTYVFNGTSWSATGSGVSAIRGPAAFGHRYDAFAIGGTQNAYTTCLSTGQHFDGSAWASAPSGAARGQAGACGTFGHGRTFGGWATATTSTTSSEFWNMSGWSVTNSLAVSVAGNSGYGVGAMPVTAGGLTNNTTVQNVGQIFIGNPPIDYYCYGFGDSKAVMDFRFGASGSIVFEELGPFEISPLVPENVGVNSKDILDLATLNLLVLLGDVAFTASTSMSTGRLDGGGLGTGYDGLVVGGQTAAGAKDGATQKWSFAASPTWTILTSMNHTLSTGACGGSINAAIYTSGFDGASVQAFTETWNGSAWANGTALTAARQLSMGVGTRNNFLQIGGFNGTDQSTNYLWNGSSWASQNALLVAWKQSASIGKPMNACIAGQSAVSNFVQVFNGSIWSNDVIMLVSRDFASGSGSYSNGCLVTGGWTGTSSATISAFTQRRSTSVPWFACKAMNTARKEHAQFGSQYAATVVGGMNTAGTVIATSETQGQWLDASAAPIKATLFYDL